MSVEELEKNDLYIEAKQYFSLRNFDKARKNFIFLYDTGLTAVSINIADTYVMQGDNQSALKWYGIAAEKDFNAVVAISIIYNNDKSSMMDKTKSLSIIKKLPEKSTPLREYYLGQFYVEGIAVKKDLDKAFRYSMQAYRKGLFEALGQSATIKKIQKKYLTWLRLRILFFVKGIIEIVRVLILGKKRKYFPFVMFRTSKMKK